MKSIVVAILILIVSSSVAEEITIKTSSETPLLAYQSKTLETSANAIQATVRVVDKSDKKFLGTAFFINNDTAITAAHVIAGRKKEDLVLVNYDVKRFLITDFWFEKAIDMACLKIDNDRSKKFLKISQKEQLPLGCQLVTYGYPVGYNGSPAILSVGYLAGIEELNINGRKIPRFIVNGAFNSGNSGGPLIDVNSGEVVGIVVAKIAPLPKDIESALNALKKEQGILTMKGIKSDGTEIRLSSAQVIEKVLQHLRRQVQLVLGHAVITGDIKKFLTEVNKVRNIK